MDYRIPIVRAEKLADLELSEVTEGYNDGRAGDPEPGDNLSYSYWHGWRNGAVDGGHRQIDKAQMMLAHDVVQKGAL